MIDNSISQVPQEREQETRMSWVIRSCVLNRADGLVVGGNSEYDDIMGQRANDVTESFG
jgi:hypothetical protein